MNNTIRGIPLHTLAESDFCPALKALAESWRNNHDCDDPVKESRSTQNTFVFGAICVLGILAAALFLSPQSEKALGTLYVAAGVALAFVAAFFLSREDRRFIRKVNRLDALLRKMGKPGLHELPSSYAAISDYLAEVCRSIDDLVRVYTSGGDSCQEERDRYAKLLHEFMEVITELGFYLDPDKRYFRRAPLQEQIEVIAARRRMWKASGEPDEVTASSGGE